MECAVTLIRLAPVDPAPYDVLRKELAHAGASRRVQRQMISIRR